MPEKAKRGVPKHAPLGRMCIVPGLSDLIAPRSRGGVGARRNWLESAARFDGVVSEANQRILAPFPDEPLEQIVDREPTRSEDQDHEYREQKRERRRLYEVIEVVDVRPLGGPVGDEHDDR